MKEDFDGTEEITELDEFDQFTNTTQGEDYEVQELTDIEIEETEGGAIVSQFTSTTGGSGSSTSKIGFQGVSIPNVGNLKSYGKHCGGIQLAVRTPSVSIAKVGARIGIIDKIYVTKSSIPARVSGVGTSNLVVTRGSGRLGLVTLEIHGHQQGEPKNWRFVVVRVNFT